MLATDLTPENTAWFLDFDGTLAEIVPEPDRAAIRADARAALAQLCARSGGAVAVVSGRSIEQLDRMLFPLRLPLAGVHGAERRDSCGNLHHAEFDARTEMALIAEITAFAQARPGLLVEAKPGAVALHYRQRASLQAECLAFAATIVGRHPSVRLLEGKMVLEFSLSRRNKGDAIADFMRESPFAGRKVFFAGDDKTDEAGFEAVNNMGGVTVKIGSGVTAARFRVADTGEFADLLHRMSLGPAGSKGTNIRTDHSRCAKR